jgi:hypothetical protein
MTNDTSPTSQTVNHPLTFQSTTFTQEFNFSKVAGQIAAAVATALITRWIVAQLDEWRKYKPL